jgi:hypothetical protein
LRPFSIRGAFRCAGMHFTPSLTAVSLCQDMPRRRTKFRRKMSPVPSDHVTTQLCQGMRKPRQMRQRNSRCVCIRLSPAGVGRLRMWLHEAGKSLLSPPPYPPTFVVLLRLSSTEIVSPPLRLLPPYEESDRISST